MHSSSVRVVYVVVFSKAALPWNPLWIRHCIVLGEICSKHWSSGEYPVISTDPYSADAETPNDQDECTNPIEDADTQQELRWHRVTTLLSKAS